MIIISSIVITILILIISIIMIINLGSVSSPLMLFPPPSP